MEHGLEKRNFEREFLAFFSLSKQPFGELFLNLTEDFARLEPRP
jgi:hypothetical protein